MKDLQFTVVIQRPRADVFATVSDAPGQPRWDPGLLDARHEPPGPIRTGTRVIERRKMFGRVRENAGEVLEVDEPNRYVRFGADGPMSLRGTITCTDVPEGTRVVWDWRLQTRGAMRLFEPLIAIVLRRTAAPILHNLKAFMESDGHSPDFLDRLVTQHEATKV